ncbi:glycoside hydrolase family 2 protein [Novipirellula artificiosorum]|uniref:glycoside hydrolase family 2 protein n=1 Tax=Novipirellula artificiosorum TaxID=2528016 RepID=UPI0011B4F2BB|nr:glycoside hydrolase family 2 protein [Novipirellula artificiosorum]
MHHRPTLKVMFVEDGIQISTDNFARQVTLEVPGGSGTVFEDNYFDLVPGTSRTIRLIHATKGNTVRVSAVSAEPVEVEIP